MRPLMYFVFTDCNLILHHPADRNNIRETQHSLVNILSIYSDRVNSEYIKCNHQSARDTRCVPSLYKQLHFIPIVNKTQRSIKCDGRDVTRLAGRQSCCRI